MPIIAAYRNRIIDTPSPYELGKEILSLDAAIDSRDYRYSVGVVRVRLKDGYEAAKSERGTILIYPAGDAEASGMELQEAIKKGIAEVIE
jgi:hypothetical protein